jgi:hypothetical protein
VPYRVSPNGRCCPFLAAQKTFGVMEYAPADASDVFKTINDSLLHSLRRVPGVQHLVYNLEGPDVEFLPSKSTVPEERTADQILYYTFTLYENYTPEMNFKTEGMNTTASFSLSIRAQTRCKFVDLVTNTILASRIDQIQDAIPVINDLSLGEAEGVFSVGNYKQYFSGDPLLLKANNQKEYQAGLAKAHHAYKKKFSIFFAQKRESIINSLLEAEMYFLFREPFPITDVIIENEKVKKASIQLPFPIKLPQHVYLRVASLDTIGVFVVPDMYGHYYVNDNVDGKLLLDNGLYARSQLAGEAYLAGKKLYASFTDDALCKKNTAPADQIKIGTLSGSLSVENFEVGLAGVNGITLIDLRFTETINRFRRHYKQDLFVEDGFSAKNIGAHYLIQRDNKVVNILEVSTGNVIGSYNSDEGFRGFVDKAMGLFNMEIEMVKVAKENGKKVQRILLYSPMGFSGNSYLKVYEMIPENVNGSVRLRHVEIAECQNYNANETISDFKITSGEGALFDAIQRGAILRFRNRTFSFLGQQYK